ncbi:MAG: peptidoglycan D,D-transpeptidase FtsI family protein [Minisyncoccia bacterium]
MNKKNVNRISILISILNIAIWIIPVFYLAKFQIVESISFKNKIEDLESPQTLIPKRGDIYVTDKNSNLYLVATTKKVYDVYYNPKKAKDLNKEVREISNILKYEITTTTKNSFVIAKSVDENVASNLKKLNLDSLFFEEYYLRVYPEKNFLSTILGFCTLNDSNLLEGKYGIEKFYDEFLKGEVGINYKFGKVQNAIPGNNLVLNIDYFVQKYGEKILEEGVKKYDAEGGLLVVAKPNGEILAVAEYPNYDLNKFNEVKDYNMFLSRLSKAYEPGSVMKTITFLSGLAENVYKPEDKYYDAGTIEINGWKIANFDKKGRGLVELSTAFEQSLNTGAVYIEKLLGHSRFLEYLKKFNFDKKPSIDLPYVENGNLKNLESRDSRDVNFATASYGQGISITPAHLISAFTVFANNGNIYNLMIVKKIINFDGKENLQNTQIIGKNIAKPQIIERMKDLLEKVTINGSGKYARTEGYRIGGKTGSAFIPYKDKKGYSNDVINTYIALFPLSEPKFIVFVRIDKPNQGLALVTTVPIAKKMIDYLINYYNIQPDNEEELMKVSKY